MHDEALAEAEAAVAPGDASAYTLCVYRPEWHQGVIGIVASRLKDRYHRPAIVFARGGAHELKGSGRSISGLHLRDALDLVSKRIPGAILALRRPRVRGRPLPARRRTARASSRHSNRSRAKRFAMRSCSARAKAMASSNPAS